MDAIGLHRAGRRGRQWLNLRDREGWAAYLTGNASRDDDDVGSLECFSEAVIWREVTFYLRGCGDV